MAVDSQTSGIHVRTQSAKPSRYKKDHVLAVAVVVVIGALLAFRCPRWALPALAVSTFVSGIDFAGFDTWYLGGMVRVDHALIFGLGLASLGRILASPSDVPKIMWLLVIWTLCIVIISAIRQGTPFPSGWIPWASILAAMLFGATYRDAFSRFSLVSVIWVAITASAVVVGFQLYVGHTFSRLDIEGEVTSGRMFNFGATLVIGLALVAQAAGIRPSRSIALNIIACVVLLSALTSLQQRTAWLVTAFGLAMVLWAKRGIVWCRLKSLGWNTTSIRLILVAFMAFASLGVLLNLTQDNSRAGGRLVDQTQVLDGQDGQQPVIDDSKLGFGESFTDDRNLEWRIAVWKEFVQRQDSLSAWIFGEDLSSNPGIMWSPHSQYVETLRRVGVVGFSLLALVITEAWRRRRAPGPSLGSVIIPMALLAGLTYEWPAVIAVLLGGCLLPRRRDAAPEDQEIAFY